jgi:uncharacterized protein YidB (DUF937 family)
MGLFDSIAGKVLGNVLGGGQAQGAAGGVDLGGILGAVMGGQGGAGGAAGVLGSVLTQAGGIDGLADKFKQGGLGDVFSSWVGTGANQPVSGEQVQQVLGADAVSGVAEKLGINVQQLLPMLAQFLPVIIDKLSPKGEIDPATSQGAGLESALGGLLSGGGLTSILGAVMGGKH